MNPRHALLALSILASATHFAVAAEPTSRVIRTAAFDPDVLPDAESVAGAWLAEQAATHRVKSGALGRFHVAGLRGLASGGTHVVMRVEIGGVPVRGTDVDVLLGDDLRPILLTLGSAVSRMSGERGPAARVTGAEALVVALQDAAAARDGQTSALRQPARIRAGLAVAENGAIDDAWIIEVLVGGPGSEELRLAVVDATDGAILESASLTSDATYQVYADEGGALTPSDGPFTDTTPYPGDEPDGQQGVLAEPIVATISGLNVNPEGGADPWLSDGARRLDGNNAVVTTYWDYTTGSVPVRGTAADEFLEPYDFTLPPDASSGQAEASGAQAFYTVNWLHDLYYDAGFDELDGNAQASNYGRGGEEGDAIGVYVQCYLHEYARSNAFMRTPEDGEPPALCSYVGLPLGQLDVASSGVSLFTSTAAAGPTATFVTAPLAWAAASDGAVDACSAPVVDLTSQAALVETGSCALIDAIENVQAAGAVAVVFIAATEDSEPPSLRFDTTDGLDAVTIPVVGVRQEDGAQLASVAASGGWITVTRPPDMDIALDSSVIAHEFGHYLHLRHVTGSSVQLYAMSEGWGDMTALAMVLREGDDLDGHYATATYLRGAIDGLYFGVRRAPYSHDPAFNALSFRHISTGEALPDITLDDDGYDNAEVHNAGEVWASALFDAYLSLQRERTTSFEDVRQKWASIVVTALQISPDDTTYIEGRDALIAAALAGSPDDAMRIAEAFAGRGMGSCAVGPDRYSEDLAGVVEDFEVRPYVVIDGLTIDDSTESCDLDGNIDVGETGLAVVRVQNAGLTRVDGGVELTISADDPAVLFPAGSTLVVPPLDVGESADLAFAVTLDASIEPALRHTFTATLSGDAGCNGATNLSQTAFLETQDESGATTDDFDADASNWTPDGDGAADIWTREVDGDDGSWVGIALGDRSDTRLVSPGIRVAAGVDFEVAFLHSYEFEWSQDGGVLEIRVGEGDWEDVSEYATVDYDGEIWDSSSALYEREVYTGTNPSWPEGDVVELDFGDHLGGRVVQLGFRVVTEEGGSSSGWRIDEVSVSGVDPGPFLQRVPDNATCPARPEARTGCGCSSLVGSTAAAPWLLGLVMLARRRRRSRSGPGGADWA